MAPKKAHLPIVRRNYKLQGPTFLIQILVKLFAAGVNPVDTYIRSGTFARKPTLPYTPGADGAGVVKTVGDGVSAFKV